MSSPPAEMPIVVDPSAMLTVVLDTPGGQRVVNAVNCRYVPATVQARRQTLQEPQRVVAVEVIHDPAVPIPIQPYPCNPNLLTIELFPANALRHVRPYEPPVPPPVTLSTSPSSPKFG
jgi:hypothetical protein